MQDAPALRCRMEPTRTRAGPTGSEVIVADYDPAAFAATRTANPYLKDRRTDLL